MFTLNALQLKLSTEVSKTDIQNLASALRKQNFNINQLIALTFHANEQIGFRAAWLLDTMICTTPEMYVYNVDYFIKRMSDVTNQSCKRHYSRIIMTLTGAKAPESIIEVLKNLDLQPVVEKCFDWMIDPTVRVAVKVFSAETLFNLSGRYTWIKEELACQIEFLMRTGTAAIQSKGKKLLKSLQ